MNPTESELIERARALVPKLSERAASAETLGRLPDETVQDFQDAGFYDIAKPSAFGGYELSPEVLFRVSMELAWGCPSSAWCLCLIGVHNWEPGLMDSRAGEDLWADDPHALYSSSYAPFGEVTVVEGGYRLSGRWQWSSGSDHCSWVMLGGMLPEIQGRAEQIALLLPRTDYQIIDNWNVSGLKGTGSHDVWVDNAFVPEHRSHRLLAPSQGAFDSPIYDLPFGNIFALCLCAVTQGIAEAALHCYTEYLRDRVHKYDGQAMSLDPFQQRRLSEVAADVQANRLRFHQVFRVLEQALKTARNVPVDVQVAQSWETQSIAHRNADLVTILMRASGGGSFRLDHPMQRYFRDINAAVSHAFLSVDRGSLQYAKMRLAGSSSGPEG